MFKRTNSLVLAAIIGILSISLLVIYKNTRTEKEILGLNTLAVSEIESNIPSNYINIGEPRRLIKLPNGDIWYIDTLNFRIVKFNSNGEIIRTVGRQGDNEGEFAEYLTDITADTQGNIYIQANSLTYKLDYNGGYITDWDTNANYSVSGRANHYDSVSNTLIIGNVSLAKFSTNGELLFEFGNSGEGQVQSIRNIVTDSSGNIYALDTTANNIKVYNPSGVFQYSIGTYGSEDGQFMEPQGLSIKPNNELVVVCAHSNKIQEFLPNGTFIRSWVDTNVVNPYGVSVDGDNNYYLSDIARVSIRKYSSTRVFIQEMRNSGTTDGRFSFPNDLDYDLAGNLYVLDNNGRVQKFTNSGAYLATIIETGLFDDAVRITVHNEEIYITDYSGVTKFDLTGQQILTFGVVGSGNGEFNGASGIDVDSNGNIYVGDNGNHRVQKFDSSGTYITQWGSLGSGNNEFASLNKDLIIDSSNNIYVGDNPFYITEPLQEWTNTRIQVFDSDGLYLRTIGQPYTDTFNGTFVTLSGMTFDSDGNLNVLSFYNASTDTRIQKFNPNTGIFISSYGSGGSGVGQYNFPEGITLNPITNTFSIADTWNHRVLTGSTGTRIYNLISSADVLSTDNQESLVNRYYDPQAPGIDNVSSILYFGDYVISDFNVNLTEDRDWVNVNVNILPNDSKSLININPTNAPGVSNTHSMYIVKQTGQTYVHICPDAVLMEQVTMNCANGYNLVDGVDGELSTVTINGVEYWKVTGLN
jgi:sugar lactone lactonase YvrE